MKTGKTLAATALTLGMILSGIPFAVMADAPAAPTAAETTTAPAISQDQAVANAKKLLPMLQNLTLHSVYYSPAITFNSNGIYPSETFKPNPGNRWELVFRNDKTGDDANYRVSINADNGSLVRYDRTWSNQSHVQAISRTDAKIKADHYLQQLAPERVTSVSTVDSLNGKEDGTLTNINGFEGYRFRYVRMINGIPFPYNDILIDVDASGELLSCQSEWTDQLQVPANATATLTKEQATAAYRKALPVQQEYVQTDFLKENKSFYRLEYGVWSADYDAELPVIDAQTGVAIKSDGTALSQNATVSTKPLAEQPGASVTTKVITEQTALDLISSYNLGLDGFERGKGVTREQYERSTGLQNSWQFMYFSKAGSSAWVSVGLDAKTGELLYMHRGDYGKTTAINTTTATLTKEQAQQKVIDFLSKAAPSTLTQLAIDESWNPVVSSDPANYQFRFIPLLNGSPVRGNDFRITVDGKTGVVLQFGGESKFSTDLRVTSTEPVVSLETAKEKFIEHYPLSLQYVPIFDSADIMFRLRKVKGVALVYAPDFIYQSDAVDAVTGEWPDGKLSQLPPLEIKDIKGHWA
ncbi:MAG: YcdB/YcdC domain-containing protein, partial [Tumebacillaceae bacterium]